MIFLQDFLIVSLFFPSFRHGARKESPRVFCGRYPGNYSGISVMLALRI